MDARGRRVAILDPVSLHLWRPVTARLMNRPDVIAAAPLKAIAVELDPTWAKRGYLVLLVYVVGLLLCFGGSLHYRAYISVNPTWDIVGVMFWVVQFAALFGAFAASWWIGARVRRPRICAVMLKHGRCPHCGYDLHGSVADPADSATVCPECGCAWIVADAHTP